jgi:hypothetical protein
MYQKYRIVNSDSDPMLDRFFWVPDGSLAGICWVGFWGLGGPWGL